MLIVQPVSQSSNERSYSRCSQRDKRLHVLMAKPFDLVGGAVADGGGKSVRSQVAGRWAWVMVRHMLWSSLHFQGERLGSKDSHGAQEEGGSQH